MKKSELREMIRTIINEYVEVNTLHYKGTYGKLPRGFATWWFKIGDEEKSFSGQYSDAASKAKSYAKEKGVTKIEVMT